MRNEQNRTGKLQLFLTGEHPCSYLQGRRARTLFVDPMARIDSTRAQWLQQIGFRRSGEHFYRPACRNCRRCVPVRVPVDGFQPNRSQRRNLTRNDPDLDLIDLPKQLWPEHYALYERYLLDRHSDGDMAEDLSLETYSRFLLASWGGETRFLEFRAGGQLMAVAVTDLFDDGLSAVYTFFDPAYAGRALGTYSILRQIQRARDLGLQYLYLGYWISDSRKMTYKANFRPLEAWDGRRWRGFDVGEDIVL